MKPVPFIARWRLRPQSGNAFDGKLVFDDPVVFAGHYPGAPILPGVFLIEALFQAVSTALGDDVRLEQIVLCRFYSPLLPGDELSARFSVKDVGAGRALVEVMAQGRTPAAQLTLLVAPVHDGNPDCPIPAPEALGPAARALDAGFVERVLPHRPPALLVERALVLDGTRCELCGHKTITSAEPCFRGADAPPTGSYPRTLVLESFGQSCGLLRAATAPSADHHGETRVPVLAKLANLLFFGDARVGDRLEHHVRLAVRTPDGAVFTGQTTASGRVILQVERAIAATTPITHLGCSPK
jgi:3-hydroxymyristoyl/3-hydroxydecanoyl-(acyl carrier protein) dehydratase